MIHGGHGDVESVGTHFGGNDSCLEQQFREFDDLITHGEDWNLSQHTQAPSGSIGVTARGFIEHGLRRE